MASRRDFLTGFPVVSAGVALSLGAAESAPPIHHSSRSFSEALALEDDWQFRIDPDAQTAPAATLKDLFHWQTISVPHTWQALRGNPDHVGVAWYRKEIFMPAEWQSRFVRIEFEAVFHTAQVFLNGQAIGEHIGKGYTAFQCDFSPHIKFGQPNELLVRVDNSFSDTMLPRMKSFDWANDGGITRPVHLLVSPRVFIERIEIDAAPTADNRSATIAVRAVVRNTFANEQRADLSGSIHRGDASSSHPVSSKSVRLPPTATITVPLDDVSITSPALWHFDAPHLYQCNISVTSSGETHTFPDTFGIRRFEARGTAFYLNGERVSLVGVERMAGSHPEFGMAEPTAWIDANHDDMKVLNCVFTRVHWAQDKRVLDYCDRHGILMQEEVPAWGGFTFSNIPDQLQSQLEVNALEQFREMAFRDRNHPCIVSWGLCNEVDGKNPRTREFAHAIAAESRKIDPARLLTYASNSLSEHPELDMAGDFDFISANEYYGSWSPGGPQQVREYLAGIRKAFPSKPIVVSEYGWCECQKTMPAGDEHRITIVNNHTNVFRESHDIAGAIYFDYNDYRTIVGDKGTGALSQRVHGVVDLYANRKPSFEALRAQASPIELLSLNISGNKAELRIVTRKILPAYTLRGYVVRWLFHGYDDLPIAGKIDPMPTLAPGTSLTLNAELPTENPVRIVVDILRPEGFSAATIVSTL